MIELRPGITLPMYQYIPLINQRLGLSLYDRTGSGKPWNDKDNYDLGTFGNVKDPGSKKRPGKQPISQTMKDQMMEMMNNIQEEEQPSFLEMIVLDPVFPYVLPIIIVVTLACLLVPLTGWLFTGFLTDNFAYLDGKDSLRFNSTFLQSIMSPNRRLTKLISTLDSIVQPFPLESSFDYPQSNQSNDKMCLCV